MEFEPALEGSAILGGGTGVAVDVGVAVGVFVEVGVFVGVEVGVCVGVGVAVGVWVGVGVAVGVVVGVGVGVASREKMEKVASVLYHPMPLEYWASAGVMQRVQAHIRSATTHVCGAALARNDICRIDNHRMSRRSEGR